MQKFCSKARGCPNPGSSDSKKGASLVDRGLSGTFSVTLVLLDILVLKCPGYLSIEENAEGQKNCFRSLFGSHNPDCAVC